MRSPFPLQWRLFAGFAALPPGRGDATELPPAEVVRPWREVLGGTWPAELSSSELLVIAKARHRAAIVAAHPDTGGDVELAAELNTALDRAEKELASG